MLKNDRMNRKVLVLLLILSVFLLAPSTLGVEWETYDEGTFDSFVFDDDEAQGRIFNTNSTGTFVTFNQSLILFSGGIILWGVAGAILLYYLLTVPAGASYDYDYGGGGGYGDSSQGYSRSNGRSFSHNGIDWETFTILDWIAVAEETWKKFDPGNLDCQKRLICEVHQNTSKFGFFAKKMVDVFSYLEYAELLRLPEELKAIIDEYIDAADRGRTMKKECSDIYSNCNFSVKKLLDRVVHSNEI